MIFRLNGINGHERAVPLRGALRYAYGDRLTDDQFAHKIKDRQHTDYLDEVRAEATRRRKHPELYKRGSLDERKEK